jgi:hypothetical protein
MSEKNFAQMSRKELLAYIRNNPNDDDAFYTLMDKVNAEPPGEIYPAPKSIDDLKNFGELLEKHRRERKDDW